MKKIGFIGAGVMGQSMIRNLMHAGFEVIVYTRTKEKARTLIEEGATWAESIKDCAQQADTVITIVGYPKDVEEVYLSENGLINHLAPGSFTIDMTTTSPALSKKIYEIAKERNIHALDAPVSGGDIGAKNGTLAIMVGGDEEDFLCVLPILKAMGTNIRYEGSAGFGQHTKMANQIALAGALAGTCEALHYAKTVGLDLQKMYDSISTGAAASWQLTNMAPRIMAGDFDPGFYIKHFIKDMRLAKEETNTRNVTLTSFEKILQMYEEIAQAGFEDLGSQGLMKYYEKE